MEQPRKKYLYETPFILLWSMYLLLLQSCSHYYVIRRAFTILEPLFEKYLIGEEGQGFLCDEEEWNKILLMIPHEG